MKPEFEESKAVAVGRTISIEYGVRMEIYDIVALDNATSNKTEYSLKMECTQYNIEYGY